MVSIKDLTFKYSEETPVTVLNHINLEICDGEFVAVLGHNGSGKSTLAKHLNAILLPSGGKVYVDGMENTQAKERLYEIRSRVGMVFQNPDNQIVATVVEEDVAFAAENLGIPSDEIRTRVDEALDAVGMSEYRLHAPHLLSGGQKQRVAIAGVIAMKPKIIIFDEPTAMLDPSGRKEVMNTIRSLNEKYNITIILITHNMDEAVQAKRVVVINDGVIVCDGSPREVFSDVEKMRTLGLDVPQATYLAYLLRKRGLPVKQNVLNAEECIEELEKICR